MLKSIFAAALVAVASAANEPNEFSGTFSYEQATIAHQLCKASYCGYENYMTHQWNDPETAGFVVSNVIYNQQFDIEGYVGYLPSDEAIWIVFRGSYSKVNFYSDYDVFWVAYDDFGFQCVGCLVARGFYHPMHTVRDDVVRWVKDLKSQYPNYQIKTTGHSLGASFSAMMGMYLISQGVQADQQINFGTMRNGNLAYARFSEKVFPN